MDDKPLQTKLRYYGISPWEIEVLYGILSDKFTVVQEETGDPLVGNLPMNHVEDDQNLVSALIITIPVQFSEEFFQWFGFKRWEKMKSIIKEMKRRRGNRKAIRVEIIFKNEEWSSKHPSFPHVKFAIDCSENHIFNSAIEKIDVMVELLPYHLNHSILAKKFCKNPMEVRYRYDVTYSKWYVGYVLTFEGGGAFSIDDFRN
ncbi:uncharacterized protein METZ01_LOCUS402229 [marine metagenome]|uniref:Uncharacterized protein n=1 Tax=marine metagenome TaxID=408172 RepID=A0A382VTL9_9ZZZZ